MKEAKFKFVFKHPDGEVIITPAYTIDEILQTTIEDIQDTWINCDCVPVGECNYVECNCDERFGQFQLIDKLQFTGLIDKNKIEIYDGHIVDISNGEKFIVYWDKKYDFCFKKSDTNTGYHKTYRGATRDDGWVVIGNIYENTELLTH